MRIMVVSQYYYPENFRINDICEELVKRGHQVTVLTGLPNYPEGIVPQEYKKRKKRHEVIKGVEVIRCFEIGRRTGGFWRILNYLSFMWSGERKAKHIDADSFDVIYGYALSPITQMKAALKLKRRSGKKILLYCCDIWPEVLKGSIPENNPAYKWATRISKEVYDGSDVVQVTSKSFIKYISETHGIPASKIEYLPQHAEDEYLSMDLSPTPNGVIDFMFAGNIGTVQDLDCIVNACEILKDKIPNGWKVHIVGDGSYLETTKNMVHGKDLDQCFVFYGRHPVSEMPKYYKLADVCLITLKGDTAVGLTIPSKLQGYMAAAKPVIGAINGSAKEIIDESGCGLCVSASDYVGLASAMQECIDKWERFEKCGKKGRQYFKEHFTKEIFMDNLEKRLEEMCDKDKAVSSTYIELENKISIKN